MRGLAAAALALAIAIPAAAQRGGGHAGFSARSAPAPRSGSAFHGSFASRTSFGYSSGPMTRMPMAYAPRAVGPGVAYPVGAPAIRPTFYRYGTSTTGRNFTLRGYPRPYYGFYPGVVYLSYGGLYDDWDDSYDNSQQPAPEPEYTYASPQPDSSYPPPPDTTYPQPASEPESSYAYPQPAPASPYAYPAPGYSAPGYAPYAPQPAPAAPQMQYVPGSSDTVTLIFKDGRPPEQIQNYLATRSTLTILDNGRRREIALTDLDIPATIKANRETGVDFELPAASR